MGQKTNPISNRLGIINGWYSIWFNDYPNRIREDNIIRKYINLKFLGISSIYIERTSNRIIITICTSRPAIVIGKGGEKVDKLKKELKNIIKNNEVDIKINIYEVKIPELDAILVAKNIAYNIENRIPFKKIIKISMLSALRLGAEGIKIQISGRLNGAEMARTEQYKDGSIRLSTFRSEIDYALHEAHTIYGIIGIKVWIMKGEVYEKGELFSTEKFKKRKK
jgi:small subunit ribosomal protein S3